MMTTMADPMDPQQRFELQREQQMFNTGRRTFPTTPHAHSLPAMSEGELPTPTDAALQPFLEDSTDGQLRAPPNECSNLSSASCSDKEHDTPGNSPNYSRAGRTGEKKSVRKRRRGDETPKSKSIAEYCIKTHTSPKRFAVVGAYNGMGNGDLMADSMLTGNWNHPSMSPSSVSRITPTNIHYSSDSNSNSNQSPPGRLKIDEETQTETAPHEIDINSMEEIAKRERDRMLIMDLKRQLDLATDKFNLERIKNERGREMIKKTLIEKNTVERSALKQKTELDAPRIGQFKLTRHGESFKEVFIDGHAYEELNRKMADITLKRNELQLASTLLKKRKPLPAGKEPAKKSAASSLNAQFIAIQTDGSIPSTSSAGDDVFRRPEEPKEISMQEYIEQDEIFKLRKDQLKKDETDLISEKERLDREKQLHLRELKRSANERESRYKDHEILHNKRYLMLSLLGKGGFSEVWRAYDLEENRYVACKIHHVNKEWKEEKKANYVKHAMREKDIHKSLDHIRIVKLFDLFTIDNHSFCTVLEYCSGNDLDFYLKQHKCISEKEARSIIMQVVSALVYLNDKKPPIIHYDLKPANILLESGTTCGAIKITDFGLSKIMEAGADDLELTSQFAGTYWYLPPETFVVGHAPPKISSKVDVWSVGVIFYQCIYGRKLSATAQDFILRCLQYRKEDRADVYELARHELFRPRGAKNGPPSSPSISRGLSLTLMKPEDSME